MCYVYLSTLKKTRISQVRGALDGLSIVGSAANPLIHWQQILLMGFVSYAMQ
jgi:hypothetical protein